MTIVSEIIDRLQPAEDPHFKIVQGAAEFGAIGGVPTAAPAAYVFTLRDESEPNRRATGPVAQRLESVVGVVIITGNVSDAVGGAAASDIESLKTWVRGRLIGFVPTSAQAGLEHVSGEILKTKNGYVWWEEAFAAISYLEEQS
ncbi:MAG: hypothetical protein J0H60_22855 [Rhizobiales bacterium]|nr:hypothetical protein [Hyphomicrobiales bacterium]